MNHTITLSRVRDPVWQVLKQAAERRKCSIQTIAMEFIENGFVEYKKNPDYYPGHHTAGLGQFTEAE